jgi:hypothetical protein
MRVKGLLLGTLLVSVGLLNGSNEEQFCVKYEGKDIPVVYHNSAVSGYTPYGNEVTYSFHPISGRLMGYAYYDPMCKIRILNVLPEWRWNPDDINYRGTDI